MELFSSLCFCLSSSNSSLQLNDRSLKIIRQLGEGGFSVVLLVQDSSGAAYALKKIRCPFSQSAERAMKEVDAYAMFHHKGIIRCVDHAIVQERGGKVVYILLPYFKNGNLQDSINKHLNNQTNFSEKEALKIFYGTCKAVQQLHEHKVNSVALTNADARRSLDIGQAQEQPLMSQDAQKIKDNEDQVGDLVPYAHRDIKPGNIMLSDDGISPILMDFGSVIPARKVVKNRRDALEVQDNAAEESTMPYRAPELFYASTGSIIDEKVDIWSLGATLYSMLYLHSPFETEQDSSIALAAISGSYKFPENDSYSDGIKSIIQRCLQVKSEDRPSISELINLVKKTVK